MRGSRGIVNSQHLIGEHLHEFATAGVVDQPAEPTQLTTLCRRGDAVRFGEQAFGQPDRTIDECFLGDDFGHNCGRVLHATIEHPTSCTNATARVPSFVPDRAER